MDDKLIRLDNLLTQKSEIIAYGQLPDVESLTIDQKPVGMQNLSTLEI